MRYSIQWISNNKFHEVQSSRLDSALEIAKCLAREIGAEARVWNNKNGAIEFGEQPKTLST
jgi:hypothetical protein